MNYKTFKEQFIEAARLQYNLIPATEANILNKAQTDFAKKAFLHAINKLSQLLLNDEEFKQSLVESVTDVHTRQSNELGGLHDVEDLLIENPLMLAAANNDPFFFKSYKQLLKIFFRDSQLRTCFLLDNHRGDFILTNTCKNFPSLVSAILQDKPLMEAVIAHSSNREWLKDILEQSYDREHLEYVLSQSHFQSIVANWEKDGTAQSFRDQINTKTRQQLESHYSLESITLFAIARKEKSTDEALLPENLRKKIGNMRP